MIVKLEYFDSFVCGDDNEYVNTGYSVNGVCFKLDLKYSNAP